jgi:hypothetical protein
MLILYTIIKPFEKLHTNKTNYFLIPDNFGAKWLFQNLRRHFIE